MREERERKYSFEPDECFEGPVPEMPLVSVLTLPRQLWKIGFISGRLPQMMATSISRTVKIDSKALEAVGCVSQVDHN